MSETPSGARRQQVAYLGPTASFSHQAAFDFFAAAPTAAADLRPYDSFAAIFLALQSQPTSSTTPPLTYAIVPIENSSNGTVVSLLDLLADPSNLYPDIKVCAEYYLPVHHCLLGAPSPSPSNEANGDPNTPSQEPNHVLSRSRTVTKLYTHPQVWGQCTRFLSTHLRGVDRIDTASTSAAAIYVAGANRATEAAIGSRLAASEHKLQVLAENIEDQGNNTTRFFVVYNSRTGAPLPSSTSTSTSKSTSTPTSPSTGKQHGKYKSLISFTLNHARPGSLADALAVFKTHGFNLTSIETRPSRQRSWHYIFFVECEEVRADGEAGEMDAMLESLRTEADRVRYLGCWVDALGETGNTVDK